MTLSRKRPLEANTDHDWEPEVKASVGGIRWVCSRCGAVTWRVHGDEPEPDEWVCNPLKSSGSGLQRSGGGLKRTPIRSVSDRKDEKRPDLGTPLQTYVEGLPCLLSDDPAHRCRGDVVAHHVRHKAHAGDWTERGGETVGNLIPACDRVHREIHTQGRRTFEDYWDLDLAAEAERIGERYREAG